MELHFVTGNLPKFKAAEALLKDFPIELVQTELSLTEIQSASTEEISIQKAKDAFALLQKPLIVSDVNWSITALSGFPGPFMKYVNQYFRARDFLKLMADETNREIVYTDFVTFTDGTAMKTFSNSINCHLLTEERGQSKQPLTRLVALPGSSKSVAEEKAEGLVYYEQERALWKRLAEWLVDSHNKQMR